MFILHSQQNKKLAVTIACSDIKSAINKLPAGTAYKIVDTLNINQQLFDAYEFCEKQGYVFNVEKAKNIKFNQFRHARKPLLEQLDVEYIRAVESSQVNKKKLIAAKKQQLRDVTSIDLPNDADELANFWPDVLKGA